jgi:hypothetical protein
VQEAQQVVLRVLRLPDAGAEDGAPVPQVGRAAGRDAVTEADKGFDDGAHRKVGIRLLAATDLRAVIVLEPTRLEGQLGVDVRLRGRGGERSQDRQEAGGAQP